jgi:sec-independent protein translocase protein TatC
MEREKLLHWLTGFKRVFLRSCLVAGVLGVGCFLFSKRIALLLIERAHIKVYYFSLPEVFLATVELALYTGLFLSVPAIMGLVWKEFGGLLSEKMRHGYLFVLAAIFLFYLGSVFCFFVVLPTGISFLVGYEGGALKAMISIQRFIIFCIAMIFAFGTAFELPLGLLLLGKLGVVRARGLARSRRYAVLFIVIAASVITPTPDIYNMSLLAVPLYILYEVGIVLVRISERRATAPVG